MKILLCFQVIWFIEMNNVIDADFWGVFFNESSYKGIAQLKNKVIYPQGYLDQQTTLSGKQLITMKQMHTSRIGFVTQTIGGDYNYQLLILKCNIF